MLPGNIQPYNKAAIYARVSGYLKTWQQDIGAHVTAGQVLALIDTPDLDQQLAQAKATLASAKANYDIAAVTANRYDILVKKQVISQQVADQSAADAAAKKAGMDANAANVRQLEAMQSFKQIVAPFDVRPGLKATFEMPQYPGQKFDATLVTTSNAMNATSRSMLVELHADNSDGKLLANTYCKVEFQIPGDANMVRIPATALMPVDRGVQVAVLGDGNRALFKPIQLGRDFGDSVEVTAGLALQDRVIDSPPETLQSGDAVQPAPATPSSTSTQAQAPILPTKKN